MASFDDEADAAVNSQDEFENEDEEMEDVNEADQDQDQGQDDDGGDDEEDEDGDENDNEGDDDDDDDQNDTDSPSRRPGQAQQSSTSDPQQKPDVVLTSPSPRRSSLPTGVQPSFIPPTRPEALVAQAYDIVPTIAAPQSTSINAIAATPDMRWVFSGGTDGYVRMYNWVETANGKVPLTVAQKHPFVDSVMKAGSLLTYWENEETSLRTPPSQPDEGKWTSPVYSLAVQHQALWLLSGLESGGINLQTCRHQAGTRITTLKEHTSAVSVLTLSQDETSLLSGSWDKNIHDWDLQTGKVKRSFASSAGQISVIETRPMSDVPVPELSEPVHEPLGTFSSNNADRPLPNGMLNGAGSRDSKGGDEDAAGSPSSLFGDDHGSLFGDDTAGVGGAPGFDDGDDELTRALQDNLEEDGQATASDQILGLDQSQDTDMGGMGSGGPVQPPNGTQQLASGESEQPTGLDDSADAVINGQPDADATDRTTPEQNTSGLTNGVSTIPHSDEPLTAPATNDSKSTDLPAQSGSTFLDASFDGTLRIWDRRIQSPVATVTPYGGTPPWSTGACWSPDGNSFYAGRRNNTVDEYSIHKLGSGRGKPERVFRFQQGSGAVYAVKAMPNGRHLVWLVSSLVPHDMKLTMAQQCLPRHSPHIRPTTV
jgi:transcriptional activator SPT8